MDNFTCAENCHRLWQSRTLTRRAARNQPAALPAYPLSVERLSPRPSRANVRYQGASPSDVHRVGVACWETGSSPISGLMSASWRSHSVFVSHGARYLSSIGGVIVPHRHSDFHILGGIEMSVHCHTRCERGSGLVLPVLTPFTLDISAEHESFRTVGQPPCAILPSIFVRFGLAGDAPRVRTARQTRGGRPDRSTFFSNRSLSRTVAARCRGSSTICRRSIARTNGTKDGT